MDGHDTLNEAKRDGERGNKEGRRIKAEQKETGSVCMQGRGAERKGKANGGKGKAGKGSIK